LVGFCSFRTTQTIVSSNKNQRKRLWVCRLIFAWTGKKFFFVFFVVACFACFAQLPLLHKAVVEGARV
jgi:hypothetical protein